MKRTLLRFAVFVTCLAFVAYCAEAPALAQVAQARVESRLSITVDPYCSDTKLRTSNARIRWSMPSAALSESGVASFASATQSLDVTVYKNGFDKGLQVSLPISGATSEHPVTPQARDKQSQLRAYQFRLIGIEPQKMAQAADTASEMGVVVEDLEPGVNYTWRIAIDTSAGRIVSPQTTGQALVCPADMVQSTEVPRRKR